MVSAILQGLEGKEGLAGEIWKRHRNSQQEESRQLLAVLGAILEVIQEQGIEPTPTAMFAATMLSLEKPEARASPDILAAMLHLLALALGRVPESALRSKVDQTLQLLLVVARDASEKPSAARHSVDCVVQVLRAAEAPSDVQAHAFGALLTACVDHRPKIRKAAQNGVTEVLAGHQGRPTATAFSEAILNHSLQLLPAPQRAAVEAAQAPSKKRREAEERIQHAVSDTLHWLGALRQSAPLLSRPHVAKLCEASVELYALQQPLLNVHVTEVLHAIAASTASHIAPRTLAAVLDVVLKQEWEEADGSFLSSYARLLESGFLRLTGEDPDVAAQGLPKAFHALCPLLANEDEAGRNAASECLTRLSEQCVTDAMIQAALERSSGPPAPLESLIAAIVSALLPNRMDGFPHACAVASAVFLRLGQAGAPLCTTLLRAVGAVLAIAFEPEDAEGALAQACAEAARRAEGAIAAAIKAMGPGPVLEALPLDIEQGLSGAGKARTWLLPILKSAAGGAGMRFWGEALMPAARLAGAEAVACTSRGQAKRATVCRALELQIFQLLATFASWAKDLDRGMDTHARSIGAAFANRPDLRPALCHALERMCLQQVEFMRERGEGGHIGGNPMDTGRGGEDVADDRSEAAFAGAGAHEEHLIIPEAYTEDDAARALASLRSYARNFMPLLFNAFVSTAPEDRGPIARAIAAYSMACDPPTAEALFRTVLQKLLKIVQDAAAPEMPRDQITDGGDTPLERRCTFTDLALALAGGLGAEGHAALYSVAKGGIEDAEASVQKRSYKVLGYLCQSAPGFLEREGQGVLELLKSAQSKCQSAARRFRLRAVQALAVMAAKNGASLVPVGAEEVERMDAEDKRAHVLTQLLSEVVLSLKEINKKTRSAGYEILVEIGHAVSRDSDAADSDDDMEGAGPSGRGGLDDVLRVILAGLVGQTPHMMSAAVMALARLLYEFAPQMQGMLPELVPAVLMLLRSKAREVVKSVLGFCKVIAMRLSVDELSKYLRPMLEGMLIWAGDTKNRFKLKVRVIVERLSRRCGFDAVSEAMPASDTRLLTHIRKEHARKQRRREDEAMSVASKATKSSMARTARASEWDASKIFSDGRGTSVGASTAVRGRGAGGRQMRGEEGDPMDLLEGGAGRRMRAAVGGQQEEEDADMDFERDMDGKLVIYDEGGKRARAGGDSDDDSDDDLLAEWGKPTGRGGGKARSVAGRTDGGKSVGGKSMGGKSMGGKSMGGKSMGGKSAGGVSVKSRSGQQPQSKFDQHSGKQYKAGKAGGDVKGKSKLEPYAYWPLDRKLLNRRQNKAKAGKETLKKFVNVKGGVAKGSKAKKGKKA